MNSKDPFGQNPSTQAMASSQQNISQPNQSPHAFSSLDALLQSMAPVGSANGMHMGFMLPSQPKMPSQGISTDQQTDMFLRPAASTITSHGKPCRIVDYVSRLLPQDDRRVLSSEDEQALPTPSAPSASASSQQGQRASGGSGNVPRSSSSIFATHTIDNAVICRNYNTVRGCSRETCQFRHACNRKVGGNSCGREHPGCNHNSLSG